MKLALNLVFIALLFLVGSTIQYFFYHFQEKDLISNFFNFFTVDLVIYGWGRNFGIFFLGGVFLLAESALIGYRNSSLQRLFNDKSFSAQNDLFYFLITVTGISEIFAFIFSLGAGHLTFLYLKQNFDLRLVSDFSLLSQFITVFFLNTFLFYVVHRVMHKYFWTLHQVHHSATELNVITPHRNHPFDRSVVLVITTLPVALLGPHPHVIIAYLMFNGLYQQYVHSNFDFEHPVLSKVFITPKAHRLHHSSAPEDWNKNFGILVFWDWLFGTLDNSKKDIKQIGLFSPDLNQSHPLKEMFSLYFLWLKNTFLFPRIPKRLKNNTPKDRDKKAG